jgi:hypothetical protein
MQLVRNDAERSLLPELRTKRDELELAIGKLRENKASMNEEEYYRKLEEIVVEMARLYDGAATPKPKQ